MAQEKISPNTKASSDIAEYLHDSAEGFPEGPISFKQIVGSLGARSFGLAILIFSVPMILPMPPGIPMAAGFVIAIFGVQLVMGHSHLWLPQWLNQKTIDRDVLRKAYSLAERYLGWMFRLARPRLPQLTGVLARRLSGFIFLTLGVLMILPIPIIGNILPAFACTVLALGLTDRDGLIYVIGIMIAGIAISATTLMAFGTVNILSTIF